MSKIIFFGKVPPKNGFIWESFPKSVNPPTHTRVFVRFGKAKGENHLPLVSSGAWEGLEGRPATVILPAGLCADPHRPTAHKIFTEFATICILYTWFFKGCLKIELTAVVVVRPQYQKYDLISTAKLSQESTVITYTVSFTPACNTSLRVEIKCWKSIVGSVDSFAVWRWIVSFMATTL